MIKSVSLASLSFLFSIAFWPYIASAAVTPRWAILAIASTVVLFFLPLRKLTTSHVLFAAILLYGAVSLAWSPVTVEWLANYARILIVFIVFLLAVEMSDDALSALTVGAAIGIGVNSIIVIAQVYGWSYFPQVAPPAGLFMNKNMGQEYAMLVLIAAAYLGLWWTMPLIAPSAFLAGTRSALIALAVVVLTASFRRFPRTLMLIVVAGSLVIIGHFVWHYDSSVAQRIAIWRDTINGFTLFGRGWGSFYVTYPSVASHMDTLAERPEHAHNDLLEFVYVMGIGSILVLAFIRTTWRGRLAAERAVLLAFGVESVFSFPVHMPATAAVFAVVAGRLAGTGPSLRDDLHRVGTVLRRRMDQYRRSAGIGALSGIRPTVVPFGLSDQKRTRIHLRGVRSVEISSAAGHREGQGGAKL